MLSLLSRYFSVLLILAICHVYADQIATTADNKKILLKNDGTWRVATQSDILTVKLLEPSPGQTANTSPGNAGGGDILTSSSSSYANVASSKSGVSMADAIKTDGAADFRKVKWGWSRQQVKDAEKLELLGEGPDSLKYKYTLIGHNSIIVYLFTAGKLIKARYDLEQDDVDPSKFISDYDGLKNYLRQMYGMPVSENNIWTNDMYKADRKNWGFAISLGFLTCTANWKGTTTKIALNMFGSKHIINTSIEYSSIQ